MIAKRLVAFGLAITMIMHAAGQLVSAALVPNPSFESGSNQPEGWMPALGGATYTWSSSEAHTGNHSICISNVQANHSVEWTTINSIPVQAGQEHCFGAWVKGDSDREAYFMVAPTDANGNWLTGFAIYLPYNTSAWTYSEAVYTVQPEAQSVYLVLGVNNPGGYTTGSICFDDVIWENAKPMLAVNYADGRPGSFFTFTGANFPPDSTASLIVNGFTLTNALAVDNSGGLLIALNTNQADPGYYSVTAAVNPSATTSFVLDPNLPLRPLDGNGPIANVPCGIAWKVLYLPLIRR